MTQRGPWSVKGIDSRAREAAREAAREEGMTLGAYLNKLILEDGTLAPNNAFQNTAHQTAPQQQQKRPHMTPEGAAAPTEPSTTALDRLTRRIESAEARSTLAITGIDQSVVGLLSRLENAEHNQQAMGGHFESLMDDVKATYETLNVKVGQIEEDDSAASNLRALKALEDALGKLASHVYEENELVSEETSAIKLRLETGLGDLSGRMDGIDGAIEEKLEEATGAFKQAVKDAELRAEGASRHLAERFSAVEVDVADRLAHVTTMGDAMNAVHSDVSSSLEGVNGSLDQMQERLNHAETLTNKAMHDLESRLEALDSRLADVHKFANESADEEMQRKFEERFESLSEDLRQLVASTRAELAEEIEAATNSVDSEILAKLNGAIGTINARLESSEDMHAQTMEMVGDTVSRITDSVDQRLTANQDQQGRAIERVSQQVTRISDGLDQRLDQVELRNGNVEDGALREEMIRFTNTLDERLEYLESREEESFDKVSSEVEKLSNRLDDRVVESETRSAAAIQQVGKQVSSMTKRLEQRQTEALQAFAAKLDGTQKRQDARLSGALGNVSDRLERMQDQSLKSMSPVQKAIAALAQRLEAIEDFSAPPYAERGESPVIPDMVAPDKIDTSIASEENQPDEFADGLEGYLNPILSSDDDENAIETEPSLDDFEPGYQSWADDANAVLDDTLGLDSIETSDVASAPPPPLDEAVDDPVWSYGREEARDGDIFDEDEDLPAPNYSAQEDSINRFEEAAIYEPVDAPEVESDDIIAQARRAARQAAAAPAGKDALKRSPVEGSSGIAPKRAGLVALAAVAIVGTAGALYMRGQNDAPSVNFDADANTQPTSITADTSAALPVSADATDSAADTSVASPASADATDSATPTGSDTVGNAAILIAETNNTEEVELEGGAEAARDATLSAADEIIPEPILIADPKPVPVSASIPTPQVDISSVPRIPSRITLGQAALDGDAIAQYQSGMADLRGGSFATGANWLRKASDQGLAIAKYELAILHESGTGTARDLSEARRLSGEAAQSGHVEAMYDFATYNANGEGGPASALVAAEWFRKSADFGHADSQYNLAQLYTLGSGVSPNMTEAMFWFELAAKSGDLDARQSSNDLVANGAVSPEAAQQVRQRAAAWRPTTKNARANGRLGAQKWDSQPGDQTLAVQKVLAALGYEIGEPDGVIGAQTRTAIRAFEQSAGMPATGQISERLVDVLNATIDAKRT